MPDLEKQKQEFLTLCRENIKRDGLEDLLGWLQKSDFFTAPASTRYHGGKNFVKEYFIFFSS